MNTHKLFSRLFPVYIIVLCLMLCGAYFCSKAVDTISLKTIQVKIPTVIIDAGHGGIDGGAVSVDGVLESAINLQISLRLNDLLCFLGIKTLMIRDGDYSVYTAGKTIAQKKISDLKQRVFLTNTTDNALLISLHQNYFQDSRYYGPQVFYSLNEESQNLANQLQQALNKNLAAQSKRKPKPATGIYLMEKTNCCGVLIECGFLSNYIESKNLQNPDYQKDLCCVIATVAANHLAGRSIT